MGNSMKNCILNKKNASTLKTVTFRICYFWQINRVIGLANIQHVLFGDCLCLISAPECTTVSPTGGGERGEKRQGACLRSFHPDVTKKYQTAWTSMKGTDPPVMA